MSYCNNCGVELLHSVTVCPLCGQNCAAGDGIEPYPHAYPINVEKVPLKRRSSALRRLIILLIPAICCFAIDFLSDGIINWAPYVLGAEGCVFAYAFLPDVFTKSRLILCILSDTAAWVLPFGFPVTFLSGSLLFAVIKTAKSAKISQLIKSAIVLALIGFYSFAFETLFSLFQSGGLNLHWSFIVSPLLLALSGMLVYINSNLSLKEKLSRKFYI